MGSQLSLVHVHGAVPHAKVASPEEDMDESSRQLQDGLRRSIRASILSRRPILTHLNADTSWLLQLPYPDDAVKSAGRTRYNILIDPWFHGPQSDIAFWFSSQWHTKDSSVQSIAELNILLQEIEELVVDVRYDQRRAKGHHADEHSTRSQNDYIDAVAISHEFTDHCNQHTLLELDPSTPIFATAFAADLIRSWRYFDTVIETPPFSASQCDWRQTSLHPLPDWVGISRIVSESDALYYHSAILITFNLSIEWPRGCQTDLSAAEGVIYTPHGIHARDLRHLGELPSVVPPVRTLALLHGLHDIRISVKQLNLGAHNGLQAQRICKARYWVSTHDEVKTAKGMIAPFLYRKVLTLQEAIDEERLEKGSISDDSELADMRNLTFADLASGESLLLA